MLSYLCMGKAVWVCSNCSYESSGYLGKCSNCGSWGSFEKQQIEKTKLTTNPKSKHALFVEAEDGPLPLQSITLDKVDRKITHSLEFDRVLGGGVVPGSLTLVGGQPGIGKSTILLQLASHFASKGQKVFYVSAEESSSQLKIRAQRLGFTDATSNNILVYTENNLEKIIREIHRSQVDLLIVDSIQAVFNPQIDSYPGSITQIRESTSNLMRLAKSQNLSTFIVGHINKDGDIAGPKILEHMVDTVLQFELIKDEKIRILRAIKNRFGNTDEIGLFEMQKTGLADLINPSQIFLKERAGGIITATKEGLRSLLIEIQSLTLATDYSNPRRIANGIDTLRLHQILAVIEKKLEISLSKMDIYINVVGGLHVKEPTADLAVALSIVANIFNTNSNLDDLIALGEIGLSGEIRSIPDLDLRLKEAEKIGFKRALIPANNISKKDFGKYNLKLIPIANILELKTMLFD